MKPSARYRRGSALVTVMVLTGVILIMVGSLLAYANGQRNRSIQAARTLNRSSCAEAGLQVARSYFGRNVTNWNTYLAAPGSYNPVASSWNTAPARLTWDGGISALQAARPELFIELDGQTDADAYIYIRDNADEKLPAPQNWARDNDLNVIVGAACISKTMVPRRDDKTISYDPMIVEGMLSFNQSGSKDCNGQKSENCN